MELLDSEADDNCKPRAGGIDEEEIDLTDLTSLVEDTVNPLLTGGGRIDEEEIDLTSLADDAAFTDQEIEDQSNELAKNKFKIAASAAFAVKALQVKAEKTKPIHDTSGICAASGCNEKAYTDKHVSWCPKHEDELVEPVCKDFQQEILKWPEWLQLKIQAFESIKLDLDEIHQLLYEVAVPKLKELLPRTAEEAKSRQHMLKAVATYKARFNPIPRMALLLLVLAMAIIFAFASSLIAPFVPALIFCAAAGTALVTTVIGVGVWRSRVLLVNVGCGAMIGAGVGMLALRPAGAAAGALMGAGVAGFFCAPKEERGEIRGKIATKSEELHQMIVGLGGQSSNTTK